MLASGFNHFIHDNSIFVAQPLKNFNLNEEKTQEIFELVFENSNKIEEIYYSDSDICIEEFKMSESKSESNNLSKEESSNLVDNDQYQIDVMQFLDCN